eukprot:gene28999-32192_t
MVPATRQTIRPTRSLAIKNFNPLGFGSKPQNTRSVSKRKVLARFTDNLDAVSSSQFSLRNGSQMQLHRSAKAVGSTSSLTKAIRWAAQSSQVGSTSSLTKARRSGGQYKQPHQDKAIG